MSKDERRKLDEEKDVQEAEKLMAQALKRVQLAMSEIKVKEQWKDRKLVNAIVLNHDAIVRARGKYAEAAHAIGVVRQLRGLTVGPQRPEGRVLKDAEEQLDYYRRELERFQAMS